MAKKNEFARVMRQVRVMAGEARRLREGGIRLLIRHRFWQPGGPCMPGEEVLGIWVVYRRREFAVPLSLRLRLLIDFLANHRDIAQSAGQIAARISMDKFYRLHGTNAKTKALLCGTSRTAINQQIMRLRAGLRLAFRKAGLNFDPLKIVVSKSTTTNEVLYRLQASVRWLHSEL